MKKHFIFIAILLSACGKNGNAPDATGVFEAQETIISAEAAGVLRQFSISEGQNLEAGQEVGAIDCTGLGLQKDQISASERALELKKTQAAPQNQIISTQIAVQESQIATQNEQLSVLENEQSRLKKLVAAQAAPSKQLDDANGQISILKKQILANQAQVKVLQQQMRSQTESSDIANRGILSEKQLLAARKAQLDDQISRCKILNPVKGTVLSKYVERFEMAAPGKALYKIANLEKLTLRAYVTGEQLPNLKLGQPLKIEINPRPTGQPGEKGDATPKTYTGTITWVSDKAEFTPKSIQTKNERANLVYAVKIEVPNDGFLKIGMYGDVRWTADKKL